MARAIWKGILVAGELRVPVKLYSAVQDRTVRFRLLDERSRRPVKQRMVDPEDERPVPQEQIRRGFEVDEGTFVVLEEEELAQLEPEGDREMEITRFVPPAELGHQWYERPYYLGPDGDEAAYAALREALRRREVEGVVAWTMRKKEYRGALRVRGDHLVLITLRHAEEVLPAGALPRPAGRKLERKELAMAEQLVGLLEDEFDPAAFQDEYRERVLEFIAAKAKGQVIRLRKPKARAEPASLSAALESSLAAAGGGAKRGGGGRRGGGGGKRAGRGGKERKSA
jgi:DNA end-binding protein Ku